MTKKAIQEKYTKHLQITESDIVLCQKEILILIDKHNNTDYAINGIYPSELRKAIIKTVSMDIKEADKNELMRLYEAYQKLKREAIIVQGILGDIL